MKVLIVFYELYWFQLFYQSRVQVQRSTHSSAQSAHFMRVYAFQATGGFVKIFHPPKTSNYPSIKQASEPNLIQIYLSLHNIASSIKYLFHGLIYHGIHAVYVE